MGQCDPPSRTDLVGRGGGADESGAIARYGDLVAFESCDDEVTIAAPDHQSDDGHLPGMPNAHDPHKCAAEHGLSALCVIDEPCA